MNAEKRNRLLFMLIAPAAIWVALLVLLPPLHLEPVFPASEFYKHKYIYLAVCYAGMILPELFDRR